MCTPRGISRSFVGVSTPGLGLAYTLLCLCLCPPFAALAGEARKADAPKPSEPAEEKWLREAERELDKLFVVPEEIMAVALEKALFDAKAMLRRAEEVARKGPESSRPRAAALVGKTQRLALGDSSAALRAVAPFLIGEAKAKAWAAALAQNLEAAVKKWDEDTRQLKAQGKREKDLPKKPEMCDVFAPFPPVAEWDLAGAKVRCAIEAGYAFLALGRQQDALAVFRQMAEKNRENLAEVLSSEGGGDLHCQPGQYEKAVGFLEYALKTARHLISYLNDDPFGEARHAQGRIEKKLVAAKRLWDVERYGEGFVDYKAAETLRRKERRFLDAFLAYATLQEKYPKTIYEAAGQSYQGKCMLALADPAEEKKAREAIAKAEKAYEGDAKLLAAMQKDHKELAKNKQLIQGLREFIEAERAELAAMKAVPLGKAASVAVQKQVEAMLKENEWGLYCGELLCDLAHFAFERQLDPEESEKRYSRAWAWLEKVEQVDVDLAAYEVPDKAREASRPPQQECRRDEFGNLKDEDVPIGALVHRRCCPWYLNDLREKCALALGFLCCYRGEKERAIAWYDKLASLDEKTARLANQKSPNNCTRMTWGAEHGYLYAHPEELRLFEKKLRFPVLAADFFYCTDRFGKAGRIAERLLSGEFGKLMPEQRDYAWFLKASAVYWTDKKMAFLLYEKVLETRENTYTEDRAAFILGNMAVWVRDNDLIRRGLAYQRDLAHSGRRNEFVYKAKIEYGWRLLGSKQETQAKEGVEILKSIPTEADGYHILAQRYLKRAAENRAGVRED